MNETQVKELFTTAVGAGPSSLPDIDRAVSAGRRRRRTRMAAALSSVAAVTLLVVGIILAADSRTSAKIPVIGPTASSSSASPTAPEVVTAQDWGAAVLTALPFRDQLTPVSFSAQGALGGPLSPTTNPDDISAAVRTYADLQYTDAGRSTGLLIRVEANNGYASYDGSPQEVLRAHCITMLQQPECGEVRDTPQGPVAITRGVFELGNQGADTVEYLEAANLRPSGQLVSVYSFGTALNGSGEATAGPGAPGMADDVERLIATATTVPEPPLVADAKGAGEWEPTLAPGFLGPTPVSSPTADSEVRTEKSGRAFDVGSGATVTVGPGTACAKAAGGAETCAPASGGGERDVSKAVVPLGSGGRVLVVGNHALSTADIGSIVVRIDGRTTVATLVRLGAKDEHLAYYAVLPGTASSNPTVEVFNRRGRLIAQNLGS